MKAWRVKNSFSNITLAVTLILLSNSVALGQKENAPCRQSSLTDAPVVFAIVGDKNICYEVNLKPGEFFQVRVEQKDSEILLRLLDLGGTRWRV